MSIQRIITHPGSAHKDEFLACCVLLVDHPVAIERRDPTPNDLTCPRTAVVDVGMLHQPELHNFDHHQFAPDTPPICSLSLVLQHLGLYEDARRFCPWLEAAEWFDCRGANRTSEWLGIDLDILSKVNSPIDVTLLRRFSQHQKLQPDTPLWQVMQMIGEDLLNYIRGIRSQIDTLAKVIEVWDIEMATEKAKAIFIPRISSTQPDLSGGLFHYLRETNLEGVIIAQIYPDNRGEGFGLKRINDYPGLDFTRIDDLPDVHFTHKAGFIAKTSATAPARLKELLYLALVH